MSCSSCQTCKAAEETNGLWPHYDSPKCKYCAARLIKTIGTLKAPTTEEKAARRRVVLQDAIAWGHSELEIRALYKAGPWVQPVQAKGRK